MVTQRKGEVNEFCLFLAQFIEIIYNLEIKFYLFYLKFILLKVCKHLLKFGYQYVKMLV